MKNSGCLFRVISNNYMISKPHLFHTFLLFLYQIDEARVTSGLSTSLHKKTDYDRLALSLTSPLPNEQDFGINVCTLLSNEGRHTLKLEKSLITKGCA